MADHKPSRTADKTSGTTGTSQSHIVALVTLLPVSGTLLFLAGLILTGTIIGLAVATPVFVLFSPIIVPAAFVIAMSVLGFVSSGAFGITGLSSLSWMANYVRRSRGYSPPKQMEGRP